MSISSNESFNEDLLENIYVPSPTPSCLDAMKNFDSNEETRNIPEYLTIIAEPFCPPKVRYRKDYISPSTRRDSLMTNNSKYNGPAINIPPSYLNVNDKYYIGVFLATVLHEKTNCHYIHPYELESIDHAEQNDRINNIVWYPIAYEDVDGTKSFPDLRIVRKKEEELKKYGQLRPVPGLNSNLLNNSPQILSKRQIVQEYNLKKGQLVFCIGQKMNLNDEFPVIVQPDLIILSEIMTLIPDEATNEDDKPTESLLVQSNLPLLPNYSMDKYAPRYGYTDGGEEMIILFKNKIVKKYGKLQTKFQSDIPNMEWSANIDEVEIDNKTVSFRVPKFPHSIDESILVKIILLQENRTIQSLQYTYIPKSSRQCTKCRTNPINPPKSMTRNNSNKRIKSSLTAMVDEESDAIVPGFETNPVLEQSKSEPESTSSILVSSSSPSTNKQTQDEDIFSTKLQESIGLLFTTNDFKPLLRTCRSFIRKRPELIHQAIEKNYSDLMSAFVPIAGIELLNHKNQLGETALLQAIRLKQFNIIKAILEREKSDQFLDNTNDKGQNIFHILALTTDSNEILDLFIEYLLQHKINVSEKFDYVDKDNYTPLQLAISNKNLSITRQFFKYFNKNIRDTFNHISDNLIHLTVRSSDITMLKYLLDEQLLIEQGNQSNTTMTPIQLARSMKHDDMAEYLEKIYSQPTINEQESSDSD